MSTALAGCTPSQDDAAAMAPPSTPEVSVVTVTPAPLVIEDRLPGRVVPLRVAEVRPQVGGIVRARLFTEGETVRVGQPLYRIDSSVFQAEVAGAKASAERQRAALELATREAERSQRLAQSGAETSQSADSSRSARAVAQAELALSEATLKRNQINLRYATVSAPISGRIGLSRVTEGALIGPSDALSLTTIQQVDEVYVDIKQPASRYEELREAFASGELQQSDALPVTLWSLRGTRYDVQGRLLFTDISVEPTTGELTLRVHVPNPDLRLLPGMFVRAHLAVGRLAAALTVPQQAIRRDPTLGEQVLVVEPGERIAARSVRTGRVVNGQQLVREGLAPGDRVVVEGHDAVRPGMPVQALPWAPPAAAAPPPSGPAGE